MVRRRLVLRLPQVRDPDRDGYILFLEVVCSPSSLQGRPTFNVIKETNANVSLLAPYNSHSPAVGSVRNQKIEQGLRQQTSWQSHRAPILTMD